MTTHLSQDDMLPVVSFTSFVTRATPVLVDPSTERDDLCQNRCLPTDGSSFFLAGPSWSEDERLSACPGDGGTGESFLSDPFFCAEDSALGREASRSSASA